MYVPKNLKLFLSLTVPYRYDGHGMRLDDAVGGCDKDRAIVLLAHQPWAAKRALDSKYNIQLVLSGTYITFVRTKYQTFKTQLTCTCIWFPLYYTDTFSTLNLLCINLEVCGFSFTKTPCYDCWGWYNWWYNSKLSHVRKDISQGAHAGLIRSYNVLFSILHL